MGRYTLYLFEAGASTPAVETLDCAGDGEAINAALDLAAGRAIELWNDERRVLWSSPMSAPRPSRRNPPSACAAPRAPRTGSGLSLQPNPPIAEPS